MTAQDIYNVKKASRIKDLCGHTPLETLLDELEEKGVMYDYKKDIQGHNTSFFCASDLNCSCKGILWSIIDGLNI